MIEVLVHLWVRSEMVILGMLRRIRIRTLVVEPLLSLNCPIW